MKLGLSLKLNESFKKGLNNQQIVTPPVSGYKHLALAQSAKVAMLLDMNYLPTVDKRTLSGGLENTLYQQNVSADVTFTGSSNWIDYADTQTETYGMYLVWNLHLAVEPSSTFSSTGGHYILNEPYNSLPIVGMPGVTAPIMAVDPSYTYMKLTLNKALIGIVPGDNMTTMRNKFKAYIDANPLTIRYKLATPKPGLIPGAVASEYIVDGVLDLIKQTFVNSGATTSSVWDKEIKVDSTANNVFRSATTDVVSSNTLKTVVFKAQSLSGVDRPLLQIKTLAGSTLVSFTPALDDTEYRVSFTPTGGGYKLLCFATQGTAEAAIKRYYDFSIYEGDYVTGNPPLPASGQDVPGNTVVHATNNGELLNFSGTSTSGIIEEVQIAQNGSALPYGNLMLDTTFSDVANWNSFYTSRSIVNGNLRATFSVGDTYTWSQIYQNSPQTNPQTVEYRIGKRFYGRAEVRASIDTTVMKLELQRNTGGYGKNLATVNNIPANTWTKLQGITSLTTDLPGDYLGALARIDSATPIPSGAWYETKKDSLIVVELTNNPIVETIETRLGRQLTLQECDRLFSHVNVSGSVNYKYALKLMFDGVNDRLKVIKNPNNTPVGNQEVAYMFSFTTHSTLSTMCHFSQNDISASTATNLYTYSDGRMLLTIGGVGKWLAGVGELKPNTRYNVLGMYSGGKLNHYVNGALKIDDVATISFPALGNIYIGARVNNVDETTFVSYMVGAMFAYTIFYDHDNPLPKDDIVAFYQAICATLT